jgi:hypothetical protein
MGGMIRTVSIAVVMLALNAANATAATCAGANPAITSVTVKSVENSGSLSVYHLTGTVTNLGAAAQPSNTLQSVDITQYGVHLDRKGIPPLAPGQSYTFPYVWQRSGEAARGTTTLDFRIAMRQGSDCNPGNGVYRLSF